MSYPLSRPVCRLSSSHHTHLSPLTADYVFEQRKFGGNAQAITGKRWLHHTSFLWDYDPAAMALLKHPPRSPKYREVVTEQTS